jgi:hypothetical protein
MDSHKQEIVEKLQSANNILVTVSSNPSVDQLAACIGLTLLLNKLDKHATAVFSGETPSTIEFLKPQETIEKNTDSLRDFIIALDKSKADKLRYKVEDKVVKIFITPYRTSLSGDDLIFSQGDFNIDVVVALGVHQQTDLDQAITTHGRILHDATVACINNTTAGDLGTVNWEDTTASSLSELVVELAQSFDKPLLDEQVSTALLTGIVAETDRFRNEKTTATTMSISAELMKAGANQQLVAKELEHEVTVQDHGQHDAPAEQGKADSSDDENSDQPKNDDGTLEIDHVKARVQNPLLEEQAPAPDPEDMPTLPSPVGMSEAGDDKHDTDSEEFLPPSQTKSRTMITEEPQLGGQLTANTSDEDESVDLTMDSPSTAPGNQTILERDEPAAEKEEAPVLPPAPQPQFSTPPPAPQWQPPILPPAPEPAPTPPTPTLEPLPAPLPPQPTPAPTPPAFTPPSPPSLPPVPATTPGPTASNIDAPDPTHATLTELEDTVGVHVDDDADAVEKARQEVLRAINERTDTNLPPVQALNAQPLGAEDLHQTPPPAPAPSNMTPPSAPKPQAPAPLPPNAPDLPPMSNSPADQPLTMPLPPSINLPPPQTTPPTNAPGQTPNSPPPVPPPMMPPSF